MNVDEIIDRINGYTKKINAIDKKFESIQLYDTPTMNYSEPFICGGCGEQYAAKDTRHNLCEDCEQSLVDKGMCPACLGALEKDKEIDWCSKCYETW